MKNKDKSTHDFVHVLKTSSILITARRAVSDTLVSCNPISLKPNDSTTLMLLLLHYILLKSIVGWS